MLRIVSQAEARRFSEPCEATTRPCEASKAGWAATERLYKCTSKSVNERLSLSSGGDVLDLGCAPGAWLQVACRALGPPGEGGTVLGLDLQVREVKGMVGYPDCRV